METKAWWASKTIWTGLAIAAYAVLSAAGVLPAGISDGVVEQAVVAVLGVLTIVFRKQATAVIGTPTA